VTGTVKCLSALSSSTTGGSPTRAAQGDGSEEGHGKSCSTRRVVSVTCIALNRGARRYQRRDCALNCANCSTMLCSASPEAIRSPTTS
jgi:hypothetical protein